MAEGDGNFVDVRGEDYVAHEYSESLPQRADDEESNQEKQTEEPQLTSVNGRENNVSVLVCAESVSQSTSLEGGDPQPTDNHRHLQQREPVTNVCQHCVQTPYQGFLVLVFVFVKWLREDIAVYEVYMIPNSNQQDGYQIRSLSESRLPSKGAKATFYVRYQGRSRVLCQAQGKITLTVESCQPAVNGPAKRMDLLFSISNC